MTHYIRNQLKITSSDIETVQTRIKEYGKMDFEKELQNNGLDFEYVLAYMILTGWGKTERLMFKFINKVMEYELLNGEWILSKSEEF